MQRNIYEDLKNWKTSRHRKPLLLQGARQVGKTYIVALFGQREYHDYVCLNFEQYPEYANLFERSLDPARIIEEIGLLQGRKLLPGSTLLFFDEIQECPRALISLKYFYEQTPEYHIIAAGSLLGVKVGKANSFPVGKIEQMTMYPMTFQEFLLARGEERIVEMLKAKTDMETVSEPVHLKLQDHLKRYLFIGGMPEIVDTFLRTEDITLTRELHNQLLGAYANDFSKHTSQSRAMKTTEIWNSIPRQLARENKKFKYGDAKKGKGASYFQETIEWLKNAGLVIVAHNITKPDLPLGGYADHSKFKLYLFDCGLLGAMLHVSSELIVSPNDLFRAYNGAFIENFVATQLIDSGHKELFYWTSGNTAEVDFILQMENRVVPLEVKSGTSLRMKSLNVYGDKYHPSIRYRTSPRNFDRRDDFCNLPLYAVGITPLSGVRSLP